MKVPMNFLHLKKWQLYIVVALIALSIPLTVMILRQRQETRSQAAKSTILSIEPSSTETTPLQKSIGEEIEFIVTINPGTNLVSLMTIDLSYDPQFLGPFTPNSNPQVIIDPSLGGYTFVEGPSFATGKIQFTIQPGNVVNSIQKPTAVARVKLKTLAATNNQATMLSFGASTVVLSIAETDSGTENVLSSTNPTFVRVGSQNDLTPTPPTTGTRLSLTALLHAIGNAGDNVDPTNAAGSNKNPLRKIRGANIALFTPNQEETPVAIGIGSLIYGDSTTSGDFKGIVALSTPVTTGDYIVKVKTDQYLTRRIPGIQRITADVINPMPAVTLVVGDIETTRVNNKDVLNIKDFNVLRDCHDFSLAGNLLDSEDSRYNSQECKTHIGNGRERTDLNDDGRVSAVDLNYFLRELSVQSGE
ncbi:MAG TPA: hypothetical protein VJC10_02085 [Patescibacteria group bacterium]|nr:hypothetical protein [Patescibacteria group bacterium]